MSAATDSSLRVVRHPIRGALAGLVFGLGLAILLVSFSVIALGTLAPLLVVAFWLVAGVLLGTLVPPLGKGALSDASPPAAGTGAADPSEPGATEAATGG